MTGTRLTKGGRIDRSATLQFQLEGRRFTGYAGDTLASALLANGIRVFGRSFKYHRPRGILASGIQEPNALMTVGTGSRRIPNLPATSVELYDGLVCERQNGWPSVDFDIGSVFGLFARFLSAGFYYKTFIGPTRGSWMFYERWIRRAAGLGRATHEPDSARYDHRHHHTDVLVIGSGPAGLAAALAAGRAGSRVLLVEQDSMAGGSLLDSPIGTDDDQLRSALLAQLVALPTVQILTHTSVFGLYDGLAAGMVERRPVIQGVSAPSEVLHIVRANQIIHATGALEQPLLFGNNDRPGVMLAGAVRAHLHRYALRLGDEVVVVTNHDSAWSAAFDLADAGARVTVVDERPAPNADLLQGAKDRAIAVLVHTVATRVFGSNGVKALEVRDAESGAVARIACDLVAMSGGWIPTVQLTTHGGVRTVFNPTLGVHVAGPMAAGQSIAGAASGDPTDPLKQGHAVGVRAAQALGFSADAGLAPESAWSSVPLMTTRTSASLPAQSKVFIDFQSDVTLSDMHVSLEDGFESPEHLKRYTALGMATDQGKSSHYNGLTTLSALRGQAMGALGTTTHRPPYTPVTVGVLAGRSVGLHFRATRRTPMHEWHMANGVTMIEAGPWFRPWYYRWAGADVGSAYIEEMRVVRSRVGLSDVSSLGKIELTGPDVGIFLDRVYVNGFSSLAVGKARYGVMLNDDGTVLDDGTTARLGEHRYFLTTTTAQAGEVMSWLEFLLQTVWPDLRVQAVSVTDRWAAMSLAGPYARDVLARALPEIDVSNAALPHMGVMERQIGEMPVRIGRLSFSGELAYEVYVPADYGVGMWEHLLAVGADVGIRPYGLEALASLRIEKGHVAGIELDHRNTLRDLGLGKMGSRAKSYIGRALSERSELVDTQRWSLVGLELVEPAGKLRGGAILFAKDEPIQGHGRGYITSVTWSTVHERLIALALYRGGLNHVGEEIVCAYPLRGEQVRARIVSPMFIDPAGERLHA